jgi:diguanylate cyclase (GGDEF)-like protein
MAISTQTIDSLTGLPNSASCQAKLAELTTTDAGVAVCLVDLDCFGDVNDAMGRETADTAIANLAKHLQTCFADSGEAFRFGGDAVMVLLPEVEKEQAFLSLEEARRSYEDSAASGLTFSGGVAASPDDGSDADTLIRKCSEALYRAKLSGRDKVCLAREEKMVTKTVHYRQGQLEGISRLAKREGMNEASLLREALDDLLRKHNA